jgi:hypothetical protein
MATLLEIARHPLVALAASRRHAPIAASANEVLPVDPYERQRSHRLAQLEAAGKCLARPGKHGNLRYWPSECGSRVLLEHRRRQRAPRQ